jgi:hypothetical protein
MKYLEYPDNFNEQIRIQILLEHRFEVNHTVIYEELQLGLHVGFEQIETFLEIRGIHDCKFGTV